jgi:hypothetical protein
MDNNGYVNISFIQLMTGVFIFLGIAILIYKYSPNTLFWNIAEWIFSLIGIGLLLLLLIGIRNVGP